jgi:hypothetical protein
MNFLRGTALDLRIVIGILVALCLALVVAATARSVQEGDFLKPIPLLLFFLPLAVGLAFLQAWARIVVVVMLWIYIAAVFVTTIHPMADDSPAQESLSASVWFIVPHIAIGLYFLHVLGKHKALFHWRAAA